MISDKYCNNPCEEAIDAYQIISPKLKQMVEKYARYVNIVKIVFVTYFT